MKRLLFSAAVTTLLLAMLLPSAAIAGPSGPPDYGNWNPTGLGLPPEMEEWGLEKALPSSFAPGGEVHIVTDPLVDGGENTSGWVTFWCQSRLGLQYNVGATGLTPGARYMVHAMGASFEYALEETPGGIEVEPGLWLLPWTFQPEQFHLGSFQADANGNGGARGVSRLVAGRIYDVGVVVLDGDHIPVRWSPAYDTVGFVVY